MMKPSNHPPASSGKASRRLSATGEDKKYPLWHKFCAHIQAGFFMGVYYLMLLICITIFIFILYKGENLTQNATGTELGTGSIIGITLGLFGTLATFIVVFFALRAESASISEANSVAQMIMKNKFDSKDRLISDEFDRLLRPNQNEDKANPTTGNHNFNSTIYGLSRKPAEFFLWFCVLSLTLFSIFLVCIFNLGIMSYQLNTQDIIALGVGMLGILITLTVILFAFRATRLSQVAGRIESYSTIEKLNPLSNALHHELLTNFLGILYLTDKSNLRFLELNRIKLIVSEFPNKISNPKEHEAFKLQRKCDDVLLRCFTYFMIFGAISIFICFAPFAGKSKSFESITGLFFVLIISVIVFFLERVVLSAIISSEMQASNVSRSEFKHQEEFLQRRIDSLKSLRYALETLSEPGSSYDFEKLAANIANTLMHLQTLQAFGAKEHHEAGKNKQFEQISKHVRKLWVSWAQYLQQELDKAKTSIPGDDEIKEIFVKARIANGEVMQRVRQHPNYNLENYNFLSLCRTSFMEFEKDHCGTSELEELKNQRKCARNLLYVIAGIVQSGLLITQLRAAISVLDCFQITGVVIDEIEVPNYMSYSSLLRELYSDPIALDMGGSEPIVRPDFLKHFV